MRKLNELVMLVIVLSFLGSAAVFATAKTYQVTGPILEMNDKSFTVQKGTERWEIARDGLTKVKGNLTVGAKVTIEYRMMAASVDVKEAAAKTKK